MKNGLIETYILRGFVLTTSMGGGTVICRYMTVGYCRMAYYHNGNGLPPARRWQLCTGEFSAGGCFAGIGSEANIGHDAKQHG